jgi:hypothetical protein
MPLILEIILGAGLVILLYVFSVKSIVAIFIWQELSKGYEASDYPEYVTKVRASNYE